MALSHSNKYIFLNILIFVFVGTLLGYFIWGTVENVKIKKSISHLEDSAPSDDSNLLAGIYSIPTSLPTTFTPGKRSVGEDGNPNDKSVDSFEKERLILESKIRAMAKRNGNELSQKEIEHLIGQFEKKDVNTLHLNKAHFERFSHHHHHHNHHNNENNNSLVRPLSTMLSTYIFHEIVDYWFESKKEATSSRIIHACINDTATKQSCESVLNTTIWGKNNVPHKVAWFFPQYYQGEAMTDDYFTYVSNPQTSKCNKCLAFFNMTLTAFIDNNPTLDFLHFFTIMQNNLFDLNSDNNICTGSLSPTTNPLVQECLTLPEQTQCMCVANAAILTLHNSLLPIYPTLSDHHKRSKFAKKEICNVERTTGLSFPNVECSQL